MYFRIQILYITFLTPLPSYAYFIIELYFKRDYKTHLIKYNFLVLKACINQKYYIEVKNTGSGVRHTCVKTSAYDSLAV